MSFYKKKVKNVLQNVNIWQFTGIQQKYFFKQIKTTPLGSVLLKIAPRISGKKFNLCIFCGHTACKVLVKYHWLYGYFLQSGPSKAYKPVAVLFE